jgi:hypothetical protein
MPAKIAGAMFRGRQGWVASSSTSRGSAATTAAAAYLAAATTLNATRTPAYKRLCNTATNAAVKACTAQSVTDTEKFLTAISAITFPPAMQADVSVLISTDTKAAQIANTLSQEDAPSYDSAELDALAAAGHAASAAAGVVRHDLGLPPVPPI